MNEPRAGTIAAEVERRQQEDDPLAEIAGRITKAAAGTSGGWFGRLLPPPDQGGIPPQAFAAQLLNMVRRSARDRRKGFYKALVNDPDSFMFVATDCAALNLRPAEEFWWVPFEDRQNRTGHHFTGMPGWKGELQQIYRSGSVRAVKFGVVYQGDHWRWRPMEMELPEYEPLAEDHDPGNLRRAYAYAEFHGGGISQVVVFGRYEIMRAKAKSKAPKDFWESEWEPEMWLKTVLHRLYDYVPHSAAYNTQLMKAWAVAMERYPAIQLGAGDTDDGGALPPGTSPGPEPVAGQVVPEPPSLPDGNGKPAGQASPPSEPPAPPADGEAKASARTWSRLRARFARADLAGDEHEGLRLVIIGALASGHYREVTEESRLSEAEALYAIRQFDKLQADAEKAGQDLAGVLRGVHDRAIAGRDAAADEAEILSGEATAPGTGEEPSDDG